MKTDSVQGESMVDKLTTATRIDFTGALPGFISFPQFNADTTSLLRDKEHESKILVVVDRAYGLKQVEPHIVHDHLNFSGDNPLVGPNPACGDRFPVINNIYLTAEQTLSPNRTLPLRDPFMSLPTAVAAGLKVGVVPNDRELEVIASLGADCYCYNLVPTMLVAAHAGFKVLGILLPEGQELSEELAKSLRGVTK